MKQRLSRTRARYCQTKNSPTLTNRPPITSTRPRTNSSGDTHPSYTKIHHSVVTENDPNQPQRRERKAQRILYSTRYPPLILQNRVKRHIFCLKTEENWRKLRKLKKIEENWKKVQKSVNEQTNFAGPQSAPRPQPDSKEQCFEREAYASLPFLRKTRVCFLFALWKSTNLKLRVLRGRDFFYLRIPPFF